MSLILLVMVVTHEAHCNAQEYDGCHAELLGGGESAGAD
jgi:hypothetical protein